MKHLGMTALAILLIISTSAWSAPPLTAEQKTLVVSITISGQPYGDVQSANGRMGTMNQCRLFPNSSNPRSEPLFVSGSGVGYGGYCCLIRPEIAHMKGYSLGDLPYAVYGRALRCVVDESLRRTGDFCAPAVDFEIVDLSSEILQSAQIADAASGSFCEPGLPSSLSKGEVNAL